MFTFPDEESYRTYRKEVATDAECITAAALVRESGGFTRYERLFLRPVTRHEVPSEATGDSPG